MPVGSDSIPDNGPKLPAFSRGVRWARTAPRGYRIILAHDANGDEVRREQIAEELIDEEAEEARLLRWLDQMCPSQPSAQPPALRLA